MGNDDEEKARRNKQQEINHKRKNNEDQDLNRQITATTRFSDGRQEDDDMLALRLNSNWPSLSGPIVPPQAKDSSQEPQEPLQLSNTHPPLHVAAPLPSHCLNGGESSTAPTVRAAVPMPHPQPASPVMPHPQSAPPDLAAVQMPHLQPAPPVLAALPMPHPHPAPPVLAAVPLPPPQPAPQVRAAVPLPPPQPAPQVRAAVPIPPPQPALQVRAAVQIPPPLVVYHQDAGPRAMQMPHPPPHPPAAVFRPVRARRNPTQIPGHGKSEIVPAPFPWATTRRATVHSLQYLVSHNIFTIKGDVQCKRCERQYEIEYNLQDKFVEVGTYIVENRRTMHDRAPDVWKDPVLPTCKYCEQENSAKPILADKKRAINWLFLLLGQMLGCCTLEQLKYFCKHTKNHRTGAKDRVLYLTYLCLCKQLDPNGPFDVRN